MTPEKLDLLFSEIRQSDSGASPARVSGVISRLGPSSRQMRQFLLLGTVSCAVAVLVTTLLGATRSTREVTSLPPEFTLLTRGAGPLASL